MRTAEEIVRAEVGHCVSALVSTLANGCHEVPRKSGHPDRDAARGALWELCEQAGELTYPLADYEEALNDSNRGWTFQPYPDDSPAKAQEPGYWWRPAVDIEANDEDENGEPIKSADNAQLACESDDIEPYDREVFEHWIVSPWLGRKLEAKGEKVDFDFTGLCIWARTTTGQAISIDGVIEEIAADLARECPV